MEQNTPGDPSRISRAKFLRSGLKTLVVAATAASAFKSAEKVVPVLHRLMQDGNDEFSPMNREELKQAIEEKFQIELLPEATLVHRDKTTPLKEDKTLPWDEADLRKLARALSELPPHFYLPRQEDRRERKIRVGLSEVIGECFCQNHPDTYEHNQGLVILLHQELHRTASFLDDRQLKGREPAVFQVVHEFVHQITSPHRGRYIENIIDPLEIEKEGLVGTFSSEFEWPPKYSRRVPSALAPGLSPEVYIALLEDISDYQEDPDNYIVMRDSFVVPKEQYVGIGRKFYEDKVAELYERYGGEGKMWIFSTNVKLKTKSRLGYGAKNASEFLSVAAENYIRGRDYFVKLYEPFLAQERAERLYGGVREEIFRGREY